MASESSERTISAGTLSAVGANPLAGAYHYVSMKLTSRNFLFWRTQLIPFLRSQDLLGYVDGSIKCPPAFIVPDSGESSSAVTTATATPNPAHKAWEKQDQAILYLLISSMADEVLHLAVGRNTSAEVWSSIITALGSSSEARCLNLFGQFQMLRQGNSTTAEYLGRAELLVESLALAGRPLSLTEQNLYVFRGLRSELKALATSLTATGSPVSLAHLSDFLQANEFILVDDYPSTADIGGSHTAHYTSTGRGSPGGHNGGRQSHNQQHHQAGRGRSGRGGQQRGGGRGGRGGPRCQICRSHGHTAVYCFKRYTTQPPQVHVAVSGEAPTGTVIPAAGDGWYPDTGATAHATPDAGMMSHSDEYSGFDVLRVGNGAGLEISRIGFASVPS
ncbi:PREDICTED: uncharacterized protein LOC109178028 [Ipomoea nil]|uniref:uncharacterized protein LOC109178028 n=1 Tax=Ipomoea nil TaxID=35883 RepID=UPI000900974E|nr:PREDICTED: uncharacterized protein LOC109178028 [Ipomoea nil]